MPPPRDPAERAPVELRGAQKIKALTHPARLAVLEELFTGRRLTATEAAEIAGVSPSAMSYHLRALEKAGIVERADASGDARERPWQASGSHIEVHSGDGRADLTAGQALNSVLLGRIERDLDSWHTHRADQPAEWHELGGLNNGLAWMTPEEVKQLTDYFEATFFRINSRTADHHPEGSRRVRLVMVVVPSDPPGLDHVERA